MFAIRCCTGIISTQTYLFFTFYNIKDIFDQFMKTEETHLLSMKFEHLDEQIINQVPANAKTTPAQS